MPAFSYWGRSEVDSGLLASLYLDTDLRRLARRVALHVQRILGGEDAGRLPVDFRRNQRLTLNMATARAIGVHPSWRVLTEAELLRNEPANVTRRLSLASAAREAVAANLDLLAADRSVAAGRQAVRAAGAALRPQVTASGGAETIDRDRAESSFGLQPVWTSAGSVSVSQRLYSDGARARATIERHVQTSRNESREELRLDVTQGAAVGYLDVLRAKAFERIQRENLTLTRSNLELAQSRRRIGVARASEVIRWENQIAINRRSVIEAGAMRNVAEIALNRLLQRPLEEPFETAEVDLDDPALLANAATVEAYIDNPFAFAIFRDFMAAEALARSPELRQLDAAIAAQERAVLAARRAFWAPTVAAGGDLTAVQTAGGLESVDARDLPFPITRPNALNWSFGVSASLPLFTGGARRAERARAEVELDELGLARRAAAEQVEQRLRTALHRAGASWAGIDLAADAADAARRNLALVTDAYEQGVLSILDLIDAQNAALVAEQSAATAVHDYLVDLMDVHRASGRFGLFMEPAGLAAAQVESVAQRLDLVRRQVGYARLTAPVAGAIADVLAEVNENVSPGQPVVVLASGSTPEVGFAVPEALIREVREGMPVTVGLDAIPCSRFDGVVTEVGVATTATGTTFPVTVRLGPDAADIRSGMAAVVDMVLGDADAPDRFIVPGQAVGEDRGGRFVFVAEPSAGGPAVVRRRPVTVGAFAAGGLEVLDGIAAGDRVVVAGVNRLQDGDEVRLDAAEAG